MPENSKWSQTPQDWDFCYFHLFRSLECKEYGRAILGSIASLAGEEKRAAEGRAVWGVIEPQYHNVPMDAMKSE
jgi:hypothetical protein